MYHSANKTSQKLAFWAKEAQPMDENESPYYEKGGRYLWAFAADDIVSPAAPARGSGVHVLPGRLVPRDRDGREPHRDGRGLRADLSRADPRLPAGWPRAAADRDFFAGAGRGPARAAAEILPAAGVFEKRPSAGGRAHRAGTPAPDRRAGKARPVRGLAGRAAGGAAAAAGAAGKPRRRQHGPDPAAAGICAGAFPAAADAGPPGRRAACEQVLSFAHFLPASCR